MFDIWVFFYLDLIYSFILSYIIMFMQEEGVLKGQELENAVSDADYTKAIQIAFELRRPRKLFELFAEIFRLGTFFFYIYIYIYFGFLYGVCIS
jgi:hypothetical protein